MRAFRDTPDADRLMGADWAPSSRNNRMRRLHALQDGRGTTRAVVNVLIVIVALVLVVWFLTLAGYDPVGWVENLIPGGGV